LALALGDDAVVLGYCTHDQPGKQRGCAEALLIQLKKPFLAERQSILPAFKRRRKEVLIDKDDRFDSRSPRNRRIDERERSSHPASLATQAVLFPPIICCVGLMPNQIDSNRRLFAGPHPRGGY